MRPFPLGQEVRVCSAVELESQLRNASPAVQADHLGQAGSNGAISEVFTVTRENKAFFFYALEGSSLLWPHGAICVDARTVTVNAARPLSERSSRLILRTGAAQRPLRKPAGPRRFTEFDFRDGSVLYVGGLPYAMRDISLLRLFVNFGHVAQVRIVLDRMSGRSRGFGFAKFSKADAAADAVAALNGKSITSTGELSDSSATVEYQTWLRESWKVKASELVEYSGDLQGAVRVFQIIEESSRRLAECVAEYPGALANLEWRDFERMLAVVFEGLGFEVIRGRGSKDGGVDLLITTKSATFAVQAKHWVGGKRVGRSILKAMLSVAVREGYAGAVVLSTSGFTRNAVTAITTVERKRLRIGERPEIYSLCRTYVGVARGLFYPLDADVIMDTHTQPI